jgi:CBS domain-containing protein
VHVLLDTTLRAVAQTLAEESIGAVLVRGSHGPAGIVSERDVTAALAEGADPDRERARDRMTTDLAFIAATDTIVAAANLMLANEIRHLAVTAASTTIGIVSMRDVLALFADEARPEGTTWPAMS